MNLSFVKIRIIDTNNPELRQNIIQKEAKNRLKYELIEGFSWLKNVGDT